MNHHLRILDAAVAGLLRCRTKTLVVVAVYSLLIALLASLLLYVKTLRGESQRLLATSPEIVVQRLRGGRHELVPVAWADAIRSIRGVGGVTPRVWGYVYDVPTGANLTFWGADSVPPDSLEIHDGETIGPDSPGTCMVGQGVADMRFLGVGDRLPLKAADGSLFAPRVIGIFTADSALLTNDLVVMSTADLRRLFGMAPEIATDLAVEVYNPAEVDTVARKIQDSWPDVRTVTRRQLLQTYDAVFDWRGGIWAALLLSTVLAFAVLVWDRATGLSAEEYRSIGILKAVGWTSREVLELKLFEGVIVSAASLLTGLIAAQLHLVVLDGVLFARVLRGWSVLFPAFETAPAIDAYTLMVCLPLAVIPYVVASVVPAWRASITDPDSIIRS
ncbi:MAG TPA: ABC transporter permease [Methylomirabilota bacterium]|nr:ABC transporter permease [Methylomirabilota bacterium]